MHEHCLFSGSSIMALPRYAPSKIREPRIIAIESDPFAAGLNGQRRKPRVRYHIATSVCFCAKARKDLPVPFARLNDHAAGLCKQGVTEPENLIQTARFRKDFRMGGDADNTAQYLRSRTIARVAIDHSV